MNGTVSNSKTKMNSGEANPNTPRFAKLFDGLKSAHGTGEGRWVHEPVKLRHYALHLQGHGPGLGIAPLKEDATVSFAAIDLDEPDFETAKTLATLLPGTTFIERSRSGNAHVFAFFTEPIEAWVPRGIMREANAAVGKKHVEVFPKQDKLRIGMVGNYINLPYYGDQRPVVAFNSQKTGYVQEEFTLAAFVDTATEYLNDPEEWRKRAAWLGVPSPEERTQSGTDREFGTSTFLHMCAEYVLEHREDNPVVEGHRAVVYFALAKQFANCATFDDDEALVMLGLINDASPDPISEGELKRIYFNAVRGQFKSTGCDDPLFAPYAHPDCKIAKGY